MSLSPEPLSEHYDARTPLIETVNGEGQMHLWYWSGDEDNARVDEAVDQLTTKVLDPLNPQPGELILDAGCGAGRTSVRLALEYGCSVTGVSISPVEIERARRLADRHGVGSQVRFELGDYASLAHSDDTFDAALALESLQNAPDLDAVLGELFRVLRPGGRLTISDLTLAGEHDDRVTRFRECLRLPRLPTSDEWVSHVRAACFEVEEVTMCGPRTIGRRDRFLRAAMTLRPTLVSEHGEQNAISHAEVHRDFFRPRPNQIGYVIVTARKPSILRSRR